MLQENAVDRMASASNTDVRRQNLTVALQHVLLNDGSSTRAEIARVTSLTSATVSSLLAELIDDGYVSDAGPAPSTGGKPPITLRMNRERHSLMSIIVRPRRLRGVVLDLTGEVVVELDRVLARPIEPADLDGFTSELRAASPLHPLAIAVRVPGTTSPTAVLESVILGWSGLDADDLLGSHRDTPRYFVNDADAGAIAEVVRGGRAAGDHVYVHIGEGIGAAVTLGGRLLDDASGSAGEIGHVRVIFDDDSAPRCRCGRLGCLEAVSSLSTALGPDYSDDLEPAIIRAMAEHPDAQVALERGALALARTLQMVCAMLNVPSIVIGGPAAIVGETFITVLNDELRRTPARGTTTPVARSAVAPGGYVGAAQYALAHTLNVQWNRGDADPV